MANNGSNTYRIARRCAERVAQDKADGRGNRCNTAHTVWVETVAGQRPGGLARLAAADMGARGTANRGAAGACGHYM